MPEFECFRIQASLLLYFTCMRMRNNHSSFARLLWTSSMSCNPVLFALFAHIQILVCFRHLNEIDTRRKLYGLWLQWKIATFCVVNYFHNKEQNMTRIWRKPNEKNPLCRWRSMGKLKIVVPKQWHLISSAFMLNRNNFLFGCNGMRKKPHANALQCQHSVHMSHACICSRRSDHHLIKNRLCSFFINFVCEFSSVSSSRWHVRNMYIRCVYRLSLHFKSENINQWKWRHMCQNQCQTVDHDQCHFIRTS